MGGKQSKSGTPSVQVVNVRRREDAQPVYAADSSPQQQRAASSSAPTQPPLEDTQQTSPNMIEVVVGKEADFQDGQMKEVEVGEKKVLVVKEGGQLYAIGSKCTHYGAPLIKGSYCKGVVRCPWHGACFNVKTGDIEDFPGLDSVHTFQVEVRGGEVVVKADPANLENGRRVKPMVKKADDNKQIVVIIGGGPASVVCAETLRQEGFSGRVILVSQETSLPYDRIKLSKGLTLKAEDIALRKQDFYDNNDIEVMLEKKVTEVSTTDKTVVLSDGSNLFYDHLVVATGGQPRKLPTPGADLTNVFVLRTPTDANAIAAAAEGKNVVIVGSSFIGLEVAAALKDKAESVNVVGHSPVPLAHVFGQQIGTWFRKLHESKGIKFHFETSVSEFKGQDGKVTEAVLANGTVLPADVCVMGVGVIPSTDFLKFSGVNLTERGFVTVNKNMQTNVSNVYAAGDIVEFPLFTQADKQVNVQHWQMAHQHGRIAGLNIAGKPTQVNSVPFFWTAQLGKNVRYAGYNQGHDDVVMHGDLDESKFVAYYTKGEKVVAVASLGWDPIVAQAAQLWSAGQSLAKTDVQSSPDAWLSKLKSK